MLEADEEDRSTDYQNFEDDIDEITKSWRQLYNSRIPLIESCEKNDEVTSLFFICTIPHKIPKQYIEFSLLVLYDMQLIFKGPRRHVLVICGAG